MTCLRTTSQHISEPYQKLYSPICIHSISFILCHLFLLHFHELQSHLNHHPKYKKIFSIPFTADISGNTLRNVIITQKSRRIIQVSTFHHIIYSCFCILLCLESYFETFFHTVSCVCVNRLFVVIGHTHTHTRTYFENCYFSHLYKQNTNKISYQMFHVVVLVYNLNNNNNNNRLNYMSSHTDLNIQVYESQGDITKTNKRNEDVYKNNIKDYLGRAQMKNVFAQVQARFRFIFPPIYICLCANNTYLACYTPSY